MSNDDEVTTEQGDRQINDEKVTILQGDRQMNDDEVETVQMQEQEITKVREQNYNGENENQDVEYSSAGTKKRGKKLKTKSIPPGTKLKSKVWELFTKYINGEDGNVRAVCNRCKKEFDGSSKGTKHLKYHAERCRGCKIHLGRWADTTTQIVLNDQSTIDLINHSFDATGLITEHWNLSVLISRKIEILQVYKEEKQKLCTFLTQLSCRFSLTVEQFSSWYLLMVDYIDDSWEPKRKIISIEDASADLPINSETLKDLCLDWKINENVCSIVTMSEHSVVGEINSCLGSLPFGGQLVHFDCLVRTLEEYITVAYSHCGAAIGISRCLLYVNKNSSNMQKFQIAIDKAKSVGKKVTSQPVPLHATDYGNFRIAVGYKEAFCELEQIVPDFKLINLTKEQWDEATMAYKYLEELNDIACSFSGSKYTTLNEFFPKFCGLYMKLLQWERSDNNSLGETTSAVIQQFAHVREKYLDKYWRRTNLVLVIAVVLDPRFKMDIVRLWYMEIYGSDADEYLKKIIDDFTCVYNEYKMIESMGRLSTSSQDDIASPTSELDRYLKDFKFSLIEELDILAWWRVNAPMYPTLARMARDFLAIPTSRVDYLLRKDLKDILYCKDLDDDIKPALACMKWWLKRP